MKFNKNKGWVFEELERKNECLDANCFGGENPEDVEKEREKKDKEINKRFEGTRKNAEKTVGPDFEEKAKPHKVEEQFKNRKDLAEAIKQFNDNHIEFKVRRSTQEGYRYVVEYFTTEHTKPEEVLFEKFDLDEDFVDEVLPDAIPEEPIVVSTEPEEVITAEEPTDEVKENGIYMSLSSELRDTLSDIENLKSLVVTLADNEDSDIINELNSIIDDRTIHVGMLQGLMEKFDTKVEAEEVPSEEEVIIDEVPEEEVKEESLNEGHSVKTVKKLDDKVYIEQEDRDFYIASDYDRYQRPFKSIEDAERYFNRNKKDIRDDILDETLTESCSDKELVDKLVAFGTCDSEEEAEKRVARMSPEMKAEMCKSLSRQAQDHLLNDSLKEGHTVNNYKGYELDWNEDLIDPEEGTADFTVYIMKNGKEVATAKGFKAAREWVDNNGEPEEPEEVVLGDDHFTERGRKLIADAREIGLIDYYDPFAGNFAFIKQGYDKNQDKIQKWLEDHPEYGVIRGKEQIEGASYGDEGDEESSDGYIYFLTGWGFDELGSEEEIVIEPKEKHEGIREALVIEEKEIDDNPEHGYASIEDYERSQEILDAMMNLRKEEEVEGTALLRAWAIDKTMSDEEFHEKNEKLTKETQEKIEALYNELKGLTDRAKK